MLISSSIGGRKLNPGCSGLVGSSDHMEGPGKQVGPRFMQLVSKTSRMGNSARDWPVPFVQYTLIYREEVWN